MVLGAWPRSGGGEGEERRKGRAESESGIAATSCASMEAVEDGMAGDSRSKTHTGRV